MSKTTVIIIVVVSVLLVAVLAGLYLMKQSKDKKEILEASLGNQQDSDFTREVIRLANTDMHNGFRDLLLAKFMNGTWKYNDMDPSNQLWIKTWVWSAMKDSIGSGNDADKAWISAQIYPDNPALQQEYIIKSFPKETDWWDRWYRMLRGKAEVQKTISDMAISSASEWYAGFLATDAGRGDYAKAVKKFGDQAKINLALV